MELLQIENVSFQFPTGEVALQNINLKVEKGDFLVVFGPSGSGKSTLLKLLLKNSTPAGKLTGKILFKGMSIDELTAKQALNSIGYVQQNPQEQLIFEEVIQELSFGLENINTPQHIMHFKIAEMANFFGIQHWLHKKTAELSGGQKQVLNVAATLLLQPEILVLDEPTAQLDPIAANEFTDLLKRINEEFGTTIIIVEHRIEQLMPFASKVLLLEKGSLLVDSEPLLLIDELKKSSSGRKMIDALPMPLRLAVDLEEEKRPFTVRQAIQMLQQKNMEAIDEPHEYQPIVGRTMLQLDKISYRYHKNDRDIVRDISFEIKEGDLVALLGSNGSGKTTLMKIITGQIQPYKGDIFVQEKKRNRRKYKGFQQEIAYLPQDPSLLFVETTVEKDYQNYCKLLKIPLEKMDDLVNKMTIANLLNKHPEDLSGGELQKAAIVKLLLASPKLLLLDEPTKGLDVFSKKQLASILLNLKQEGITQLIVTHDVDFAAAIANQCGLFFDGSLPALRDPHTFFTANQFYTTTARRIAAPFFTNTIVYEELLQKCKQSIKEFIK